MSSPLPKLRDDLSFHPDHETPGRVYIKDPLRRQHHNFNELQIAMMKALDGKRTAADVRDYLGDEYEVDVPVEKITRFVSRVEQEFLLDVTSYSVNDEKARKAIRKHLRKAGMTFRARPRTESPEGEMFREAVHHATEGDPCQAASYFQAVLEINPDNRRARESLECIHRAFFEVNGNLGGLAQSNMIRLLNPDKFLTAFDRRFGKYIYSTGGVIVIIGLILASIIPIVDIMSQPKVFGSFSPWDIVMFEVVILPGMLLHELGHGLSCKHYGGQVDDLGIMFMYGVLPAAYCDTSDTYLFKERRHKIIVYLSGLVPHMLYQSMFWFIAAAIDPTLAGWNGMVVGLLVTLWVNFVNLVPLVPLDGYYALTDYLGINNLRGRSFAYLKSRMSWLFFGVELEVDASEARERRIFLLYAVLAAVYTVLYIYGAWISFLLPYVIDIFGVWGVALAVIYFVNLIGSILIRYMYVLFRFLITSRKEVFTWRRSLAMVVVIAGITAGLMTKSPVHVDGKVVVEPQNRAIVRATEGGLIAEVSVREGQVVDEGQVIAVFRGDAIIRERAAAAARLVEAEHELAKLERGATPEELRLARARVRVQGVRRKAAAERLSETSRLSELNVGREGDVLEARATAARQAGEARVKAADARLVGAGARVEEVAGAEAEVRRWKSEIEALDERIGRLEVRAPISGVVVGTDLWSRKGERLERGAALVEIHDVSALQARVVPYRGEPLNSLALGQRVAIRIEGDPHRGVRFEVEEVLPPDPEDEHARPIVLSSGPNSHGWRSGMTGHARIYGPERSLAYRLIAVPIIRIVDYDIWRWLEG